MSRELGPSVSIFGSARIPKESAIFRLARQIASEIVGLGYGVISGGGPGIMRAAAEGAREGGGTAVGFNIRLPFEPPDLTLQHVSLTFDNFFTRKLAFARCSHAFITMPGGMGTLDELFDILTLIQTQKLQPRPVVLVGRTFWRGLLLWLREQPAAQGLISTRELDAIGVFDTAQEVISFFERELAGASAPFEQSATAAIAPTFTSKITNGRHLHDDADTSTGHVHRRT